MGIDSVFLGGSDTPPSQGSVDPASHKFLGPPTSYTIKFCMLMKLYVRKCAMHVRPRTWLLTCQRDPYYASSVRCPSTTSSARFDSFPTTALPPTQFQRYVLEQDIDPRRSVRHRPVQSFIFDWSLPIRRFKDAFIYADREEGRTRSHRRLFLPANFQSSSSFQTHGTARRPSDYGVLDVGRAVSTTAIRHPPWTLA